MELVSQDGDPGDWGSGIRLSSVPLSTESQILTTSYRASCTELSGHATNSIDVGITTPIGRSRKKSNKWLPVNNPWGRTGRRRCAQCRKWRLKCVYSALDQPCNLCKDRGFQCGTQEKILGPKTEESNKLGAHPGANIAYGVTVFEIIRPLNNRDEALTDLDLQYLHCLPIEPTFGRAETPNLSAHSVGLNSLNDFIKGSFLASHIPQFSFGSKAYRYGYLAFASAYSRKPHALFDSWEYLSKAHQYLNEAIQSNSYLEIVNATYLVFLQEYVGRDKFEPSLRRMLVYCQGLWKAFGCHRVQLSQTATDCICEMYNMCFCTCLNIVRLLTCSWLAGECSDPDLIDAMGHVLNSSLEVGFYHPVWNKTTYELCLDYFLSTAKANLPAREFAQSLLVRALRETVSMTEITPVMVRVEQMLNQPSPWSQDRQLSPASTSENPQFDYPVICIEMACLLSFFIKAPSVHNTRQAISHARILCRLLSFGGTDLVYHTYQAIHILFWVGLVLRKPIDPAANEWIFRALRELKAETLKVHQSAAREIQVEEAFLFLLKFLNRANTWPEEALVGQKLDDPDLFHCNRMLLNLRYNWCSY